MSIVQHYKQKFYEIAAKLNNELHFLEYPIDIVTIMGCMSLNECAKHVKYYENLVNQLTAEKNSKVI